MGELSRVVRWVGCGVVAGAMTVGCSRGPAEPTVPDASSSPTPGDGVSPGAAAAADEGSGAGSPAAEAGRPVQRSPGRVAAERLPAGASAVAWIEPQAMIDALATGPMKAMAADADVWRTLVRENLDRALDEHPSSAALGGRIRLSRAAWATVGVWGGDRQSVVIGLDPAAFVPPLPADGRLAPIGRAGFRAALADGIAWIGTGPALEDAVAGRTPGPWTRWPAGAAALPADAMLALWMADDGLLDAEAKAALAPLRDVSSGRIAFGLRPDASATLALDTPDPAPLRKLIDAAHGASMRSLDRWSDRLPGSQRAVSAWVRLLVDAAWARVETRIEAPISRFTLAAPDCGSGFGNVTVAMILAAQLQNADRTRSDWPAFRPRPVRFEPGCPARTGVSAKIPRSFHAVGAPTGSASAAMALVDVSALLRRNLPGGFDLLPFEISAKDLEAALGGTPFGLVSLEDPEGSGFFYWEQGGSDEKGSLYVVLPPGMRTTGDAWFGLAPDVGPQGVTWATPRLQARAKGAPVEPWRTLVERIPQDAALALVLNRAILAPALAQARIDGAIGALLRRAEVASLSLDASWTPTVVVRSAAGGGALAADAEAELHAAFGLDADRPDADEAYRQFRRALQDAIRVEVDGQWTTIRFGGFGRVFTGVLVLLGAAVIAPAVVETLEAGGAPGGFGGKPVVP